MVDTGRAIAARGAHAEVRRPARDSVALDELYAHNHARILRLCRCILGNDADAEDATQETFLRVSRVIDRLDGDVPTFLRVVARNACRDELRRRRLRSDQATPADHEVHDEAQVEETVADAAVLAALWQRLRDDDRTLLAHSFAGYSYEETARRTGWSPKKVSVGLVRARNRARLLAGPVAAAVGVALIWLLRAGRRAAGPGRVVAVQPATLCAAAFIATALITQSSTGRGGAGAFSGPDSRSTLLSLATAAVAGRPAQGGDGASGGASLAPSSALAPSGPGGASGQTPPVAGPMSPRSIVTSVVAPDQNARQEDTGFQSITPSPSYERDHTIFASGDVVNGCASPRPCPVLFRSTDAGHAWAPMHTTGFLGGTVLLPPSYPTDPTIFVASPAGLERSDDGGATFLLAVAGTAQMAVDPRSTPGDTHILIGVRPPVVYSAASRAVTPTTSLPPSVVSVSTVAFAGTTGAMFVAAQELDPQASSSQDGVLLMCAAAGACSEVLRVPDGQLYQAVASPTFATDGTVIAVSDAALWISRDAGRTFRRGAQTAGAYLAVNLDPRFGADGVMVAAVTSPDAAGGYEPVLLASTDSGQSLARATATGLAGIDRLVNAASILPDGRVLIALSDAADGIFGIRCAPRLGAAWGRAC